MVGTHPAHVAPLGGDVPGGQGGRAGRGTDAGTAAHSRCRLAGALEAAVETGPRELDLPCDVRTSGRLSASLGEQTGVRIAPGLMRVLLHRARFANGRPKHTSFVVALLVSQSGLAPAGRVAAGLLATLLAW